MQTIRFIRELMEQSQRRYDANTVKAVTWVSLIAIVVGFTLFAMLDFPWSLVTNAIVGACVLASGAAASEYSMHKLERKTSAKVKDTKPKAKVTSKSGETQAIEPTDDVGRTIEQPVVQEKFAYDLPPWEQVEAELQPHFDRLPQGMKKITLSQFAQAHIKEYDPALLSEPFVGEEWRYWKSLFFQPFPKQALVKEETDKKGNVKREYRSIKETITMPIVVLLLSLVLTQVSYAHLPLSWPIGLAFLWLLLILWAVPVGLIRYSRWGGYRMVLGIRHLIIIDESVDGGGTDVFEWTEFKGKFSRSHAPKATWRKTLRSFTAKALKMIWVGGDTPKQFDDAAHQLGPFKADSDIVRRMNKIKDHAGNHERNYGEAEKSWNRKVVDENDRRHGR